MPLASTFTLQWYGEAAVAARLTDSIGTAVAGIEAWAEPSATATGTGSQAGQITRLRNRPGTAYGVGTATQDGVKARGRLGATLSIGSRPSADDAAEAILGKPIVGLGMTVAEVLSMLTRIARNKMVTDPATGELRVYSDDGSTVLLTADLFEDAAGVTPFAGNPAQRRERLT